jgi:hypothetical protein
MGCRGTGAATVSPVYEGEVLENPLSVFTFVFWVLQCVKMLKISSVSKERAASFFRTEGMEK